MPKAANAGYRAIMSATATGEPFAMDTTAIPAAPPTLLHLLAALTRDEEDTGPFERLQGQRLMLLAVCALLDSLSGACPPLQQRMAASLAAYLRIDFPAMVAEEEESLLPLLRARLLLGDDFDQVLRQMDEEHRHDRRQAALLAVECEALAGGLLDEAAVLFNACRAFAEQQRRHLAWEDATVLPLARGRLTATDLALWNRQTRGRRGTRIPASGP